RAAGPALRADRVHLLLRPGTVAPHPWRRQPVSAALARSPRPALAPLPPPLLRHRAGHRPPRTAERSPETMTKRVLFIAYLYPPVGGAGVQRAAKFVKYLPQFGWLPTVLTVSNPSVPLFDESLAGDVAGETAVRRARTWEPSYALKSVVSAGSQRGGRG